MKIQLQFIQRAVVPWWGISVMLIVLCITLIVANAWLHEFRVVQENVERLDQLQLKLKEAKRAQQKLQDSLTPQEVQRIKDHKAVVSALNYPWNQVLGEIEQTQEPGVAVLAFSHDQHSGLSQLTLEALETPSIIAYVRQMNGDHGDGHWYISSYQIQTQNVPQTVKANLVSK